MWLSSTHKILSKGQWEGQTMVVRSNTELNQPIYILAISDFLYCCTQ